MVIKKLELNVTELTLRRDFCRENLFSFLVSRVENTFYIVSRSCSVEPEVYFELDDETMRLPFLGLPEYYSVRKSNSLFNF